MACRHACVFALCVFLRGVCACVCSHEGSVAMSARASLDGMTLVRTQDAVNAVAARAVGAGAFMHIGSHMNCQPSYTGALGCADAALVQFAGPRKPWLAGAERARNGTVDHHGEMVALFVAEMERFRAERMLQ